MGQKIQLSESQLRNLIKESVKKALVKEWRELTASEKEWRDIEREREDKKRAKENDDAVEKSKFAKKMLGKKSGKLDEISTKMIARANKKFYQKYGGTDFPGPDAKDFPKDEHGNLLYPKDKKPLANHYREFSKAYDRALHDEQLNDPVRREAMEVWNRYQNDAHWEPENNDDYDNEGCEINGHLEVDGWEFDAIGYGEYYGSDIEVMEVEEVEFKSPDGNVGWFSLTV